MVLVVLIMAFNVNGAIDDSCNYPGGYDGSYWGLCKDTDTYNCPGLYESNRCPEDPANVKCCLEVCKSPLTGERIGTCKVDTGSCAYVVKGNLCYENSWCCLDKNCEAMGGECMDKNTNDADYYWFVDGAVHPLCLGIEECGIKIESEKQLSAELSMEGLEDGSTTSQAEIKLKGGCSNADECLLFMVRDNENGETVFEPSEFTDGMIVTIGTLPETRTFQLKAIKGSSDVLSNSVKIKYAYQEEMPGREYDITATVYETFKDKAKELLKDAKVTFTLPTETKICETGADGTCKLSEFITEGSQVTIKAEKSTYKAIGRDLEQETITLTGPTTHTLDLYLTESSNDESGCVDIVITNPEKIGESMIGFSLMQNGQEKYSCSTSSMCKICEPLSGDYTVKATMPYGLNFKANVNPSSFSLQGNERKRVEVTITELTDEDKKYIIEGVVFNVTKKGRKYLQGARVSIVGFSAEKNTDEKGKYKFEDVNLGNINQIELKATRDKFISDSLIVTIPSSSSTTIKNNYLYLIPESEDVYSVEMKVNHLSPVNNVKLTFKKENGDEWYSTFENPSQIRSQRRDLPAGIYSITATGENMGSMYEIVLSQSQFVLDNSHRVQRITATVREKPENKQTTTIKGSVFLEGMPNEPANPLEGVTVVYYTDSNDENAIDSLNTERTGFDGKYTILNKYIPGYTYFVKLKDNEIYESSPVTVTSPGAGATIITAPPINAKKKIDAETVSVKVIAKDNEGNELSSDKKFSFYVFDKYNTPVSGFPKENAESGDVMQLDVVTGSGHPYRAVLTYNGVSTEKTGIIFTSGETKELIFEKVDVNTNLFNIEWGNDELTKEGDNYFFTIHCEKVEGDTPTQALCPSPDIFLEDVTGGASCNLEYKGTTSSGYKYQVKGCGPDEITYVIVKAKDNIDGIQLKINQPSVKRYYFPGMKLNDIMITIPEGYYFNYKDNINERIGINIECKYSADPMQPYEKCIGMPMVDAGKYPADSEQWDYTDGKLTFRLTEEQWKEGVNVGADKDKVKIGFGIFGIGEGTYKYATIPITHKPLCEDTDSDGYVEYSENAKCLCDNLELPSEYDGKYRCLPERCEGAGFSCIYEENYDDINSLCKKETIDLPGCSEGMICCREHTLDNIKVCKFKPDLECLTPEERACKCPTQQDADNDASKKTKACVNAGDIAYEGGAWESFNCGGVFDEDEDKSGIGDYEDWLNCDKPCAPKKKGVELCRCGNLCSKRYEFVKKGETCGVKAKYLTGCSIKCEEKDGCICPAYCQKSGYVLDGTEGCEGRAGWDINFGNFKEKFFGAPDPRAISFAERTGLTEGWNNLIAQSDLLTDLRAFLKPYDWENAICNGILGLSGGETPTYNNQMVEIGYAGSYSLNLELPKVPLVLAAEKQKLPDNTTLYQVEWKIHFRDDGGAYRALIGKCDKTPRSECNKIKDPAKDLTNIRLLVNPETKEALNGSRIYAQDEKDTGYLSFTKETDFDYACISFSTFSMWEEDKKIKHICKDIRDADYEEESLYYDIEVEEEVDIQRRAEQEGFNPFGTANYGTIED